MRSYITYNLAMPVRLVLFITKLSAYVSRLLGRGGGQALPGLLAEWLDPDLARKLVVGLPHGVIIVTGTNGKTTTTKLIRAALEAAGEQVLSNTTGSNLKRGVVSALITAADWRGGLRRKTIGLFEVDEASLRQVAPLLQPSHILVLNLFRDQLDRYGELDTTAALIGQGIAATKAQLYLNADDPLVASLAKYAGSSSSERVSFFGIEGLPVQASTAYQMATDSDRCPVCHERLEFSRVFYGHVGHYRCHYGHFSRPQPGVAITSVASADLQGSRFTLALDGHRSEFSFPLPGTYNLYNALATVSLGYGLGLDIETMRSTLARAEPAFGRVEQVAIKGRMVYLLLIKNPAGFTQVLETFLIGHKEPRVMLAVNDLDADGRDVSWLWDVPLEALTPMKPVVVTAGIRGADMALRLHYAGIVSEGFEDLGNAVERLIEQTPVGETAYILPTYTAMLQVRKLLSKLTQIAEIS